MCFPSQKKISQKKSYSYNSPLQCCYHDAASPSRVDLSPDHMQRDFGLTRPCGLEPVPIKSIQATVVPEIKLDTPWGYDEYTADLLLLLFRPGQDVQDQNEANQCNDEFEPIPITHRPSGHASEVAIEKSEWLSDKAAVNNYIMPDTWPERLQELVQFRKQYGHCLVSHNWIGNKALAQWVKRQRYQFKLKCRGERNTLTDDRMKALNEVGFVWNSQSLRWEEKLHELAEFAREHGHCNVPSNYPENRQLSVWVRCQRRHFKLYLDGKKTTSMTAEKIQKLKSLGFIFVPRNFCKKSCRQNII